MIRSRKQISIYLIDSRYPIESSMKQNNFHNQIEFSVILRKEKKPSLDTLSGQQLTPEHQNGSKAIFCVSTKRKRCISRVNYSSNMSQVRLRICTPVSICQRVPNSHIYHVRFVILAWKSCCLSRICVNCSLKLLF